MSSSSVARHRARAFRADTFDLSFGSPPAWQSALREYRERKRDGRHRRRSRSMRAPTARRSSVASLVSLSSPTQTTCATRSRRTPAPVPAGRKSSRARQRLIFRYRDHGGQGDWASPLPARDLSCCAPRFAAPIPAKLGAVPVPGNHPLPGWWSGPRRAGRSGANPLPARDSDGLQDACGAAISQPRWRLALQAAGGDTADDRRPRPSAWLG